jgi:hypothetical protein
MLKGAMSRILLSDEDRTSMAPLLPIQAGIGLRTRLVSSLNQLILPTPH